MNTNDFLKLLEPIVKITYNNSFVSKLFQKLLSQNNNNLIETTRMTILFEGLYQSIKNSHDSKKLFLKVRQKRWQNHFGTPTAIFLICYQEEIDATKVFFANLSNTDFPPDLNYPWDIVENYNLKEDKLNQILIDNTCVESINAPNQEKTGEFVKTHNPDGGFTTTPCDPFSQEFIECSGKDKTLLEIGAGFGSATLAALAKDAKVFCNDIEPKNLAVIANRFSKTNQNDSNLILIPGSFPYELSSLPQAHFDAILACRVMHFFEGDKIEESLRLLRTLLKPEGKLFIVCETPYLKNWQRFIPEYEKRVQNGIKWPGEINDPAKFESSGRTASLPSFVHWITKDVLDRTLKRMNFDIIKSTYIDRKDQFPTDLLLDGKESVGATATK